MTGEKEDKEGNSLKRPCFATDIRMPKCTHSFRRLLGVIGVLLVLIGGGQIGVGIYFMLTPLPAFSIASNIWTGIVSGLTGVILTCYGYTESPRNYYTSYTPLIFSIIGILANILNIVIIQVGEKSKFLTEDDMRAMEQDPQKKLQFNIAIYSTTVMSSVAVACTFLVSQCLFCGYLRKPKAKGQITFGEKLKQEKLKQEKLKQEKLAKETSGGEGGNRFFPPSRLAAKEKIQVLPPLDVATQPDPGDSLNDSAWVYNSDDKISLGLYPLGLESNPVPIGPTNQKTPIRHSSFATPRYAQVHHRPKRAQSFAATSASSSPFSLQWNKNVIRPLPVTVPKLMDESSPSFLQQRKVFKSSSFIDSVASNSVSALSRKYYAFTQNRDVNFSVIEVGSLKSETSDNNSIADAHTGSDPPKEQPRKTSKLHEIIAAWPSDQEKPGVIGSPHVKPKFFIPSSHRSLKAKGPAPLPPIKRDQGGVAITERSTTEGEERIMYDSNQPHETLESSETIAEKEVLVDDVLLQKRSPAETSDEPKIGSAHPDTITSNVIYSKRKPNETVQLSNRPFLDKENELNNEAKKDQKTVNLPSEGLRTLRKVTKPPRFPAQRITAIGHEALAAHLQQKSTTLSTGGDLSTINEERPKQETSSTFSSFSTQTLNQPRTYETVHREMVEDARALLDMLPTSEVQKNKIVLRVPSFKNTGCQTESYKPLRRRASCSQGNFYLTPRHLPAKEMHNVPYVHPPKCPNVSPLFTAASSSSSGYSSPEGESKHSSPIHSGPPSPGSSYESSLIDTQAPKLCPNVTVIEVNRAETLRFPSQRSRTLKDTPSSRSGIPTASELQSSHDNTYELNATPCSLTTLIEAVNPTLVVNLPKEQRIPRIIDVLCKPSQYHPAEQLYHGSQSTESIPMGDDDSFPNDFSDSSSYSTQILREDTDSTAEYLASLEILATHYRQQALANAKQLQIQQKILEQQKLQQKISDLPIYTISQEFDQS